MNLLGDQNQTMPHLDQEHDHLLSAVNENPANTQAVFDLAESYFKAGDFASARFWYARRAALGGWDEQVFVALLRFAETMYKLDQGWPDIQDACLRAWEYRPTRAEPLFFLAHWYRLAGEYLLGYFFAERAAQIPRPDDTLALQQHVYDWAIHVEQGICASWINRKPESFALFRQVLSRPDVPTADRARLADYCEFLTPDMLLVASSFPHTVIQQLDRARTTPANVTVAFTAHHDRAATERTIISFLNCCTDISTVDRFLLVDSGLSEPDRTSLLETYPFLEPASRNEVLGRFLLRLESGWKFFAPEPLIKRLTAVFNDEPHVVQVGLNYADSHTPTKAVPDLADIRRTADGQRYIRTDAPATCPAMIDTTRPYSPDAWYATLDEVFCVTGMGS